MTLRESQISDWVIRLEPYGVSRGQIDQHVSDLTKQFGFEPPVNDVMWRTLNALVATDPGGFNARTAYSEMAQIARGEGKNPLPYLQEAARLQLLEIKRNGFVKVVTIQTVNDQYVCSRCRALESQKIPLYKALASLPVPNDCENKEGCRCWYSQVLEW